MDRREFLAASGALAVVGAAPALGQAPASLDVTIHAREEVGPLPHIWEECVGSDRAAITLRESWRDDIERARTELGIKRVRFHGIFNDELGVLTSTIQRGRARPANFKNVAEVYDGLVDRGLAPAVEMSFMPKELASGTRTFGFYQGNITPPKSYEEWGAFIGEFGRFLVDRYGIAQVSRWPFEVWNEPNLAFFWSADQAEYFKLYKAAAVALKQIDPRLQVGGPATSSTAWISEFLDFCGRENAPVDFVSSHVYAGDNQTRLFGSDLKLSTNAVIPEAVRRARARVRGSAFAKLPLYINEWSSDSPAMIAYVLANVLGETEMMSHWVLSGTYEELGPTDFLLGEGAIGFGQMMRGIPRPSYNTYRLLHALGDRRLRADGAALASRRADGSFAAMVWNLAETSQPAGIPGANPKRTVVGTAKRIAVSIPEMKPGQPLKVRYVDQDRGSALRRWRAMGAPKLPTSAQIAELRKAAEIAPPQRMRLDAGRRLTLDLPPEGVALIES